MHRLCPILPHIAALVLRFAVMLPACWAKAWRHHGRMRRNRSCNRRSGTRGHGWRAVNVSR
jgi:hypothetical protein